MAGKREEIRRSQFIRIYGPGAIIESRDTPAVILSFDRAEFDVEDFLLHDPILENYLKYLLQKAGHEVDEVRVFELPPSDPENGKARLKAKNFQKWYLCSRHNILWKYTGNNPGCKKCREEGRDPRENSTPVRFIQACPEGHMDDIQWDREVHLGKKTQNCDSTQFLWTGKGSATDVKIRCLKCRAEITLAQLYKRSDDGNLKCTGRRPEKEEPGNPGQERESCTQGARIILRMASNLRIPETKSVFMVWPREHEMGSILTSYLVKNKSLVKYFIKKYREGKTTLRGITKEFLENLEENRSSMPGNHYHFLHSFFEELMEEKIEDIERRLKVITGDISLKEILEMEYEYLKVAGKEGRKELEKGKVYLEVNPHRSVRTDTIQIVPIDILTVIESQIGYRRLDPGNRLTFISQVEKRKHFFPAILISGEGIFLDFGNIPIKETETSLKWLEAYRNSSRYYGENKGFLFRMDEERHELHPVFVFLHTFSHLFIRAVSLYAGYPPGSLKERVYFRITDGQPEGGIVIYTATEDEGGAMGGLVSLVEETRLKEIFRKIIETAGSCSNDPVCQEMSFSPGRYSGASCYSCTAISETSCEHRNLWLDRRLLQENLSIIDNWPEQK